MLKGKAMSQRQRAKTQGSSLKVAWQGIPWKKAQRHVFRLQKRMYRAAQREDVRTVHKLQKLLVKSWSARLLAVRRITQDNRGHGVHTMTPIMCSTGSCRANAYKSDVSQ
jgi:hypothetical protein